MIGGYAQHGYAREALELFERMLKERIRPNSVMFFGVLPACIRAGFVTEGRHFFTSFKTMRLSQKWNFMVAWWTFLGVLDY